MTEMEMYLMKEVNDIKEKMVKVETLLSANASSNAKEMAMIMDIIKNQQDRDKETAKMLIELKGDVNRVMGRTDNDGPNINIDAGTSISADRDVNTGDITSNGD